MRWAVRLAVAAGLLVALYGHTRRVFDLTRKEYGEGPILAMVERWRQEPISARWLEGPQWTLSCYGPGYYAVVRLVSPWTPWDHTLIPGRLVSLLALVATSAMVALIVYRESRSATLAQIAALTYLFASPVLIWLPFARVDSLAVFFAVSAYAAVGPRKRNLVLSGLLIVIGSLVKQPVALCALPICAHLVLNHRRREALGYLLGVGTLGAALWSLLAWASGGYFFAGAIVGNLNPLILSSLPWKIWRFWKSPLAVSALGVLVYLLLVDRHQVKASLYASGLLVSAVLSSVLIAKEGSGQNYYLEAAALATVVVALYGFRVLWTIPQRWALALLLGLTAFGTLAGAYSLKLLSRPFAVSPCHVWVAVLGERHILADGTCMDALATEAKLPVLNDPYLYRMMVENGALDADPLVAAMASGEVAALVLERSVEDHRTSKYLDGQREYRSWATPVVDAMRRYYVLVQREPGFWLYMHRSLVTPALLREFGLLQPPPAEDGARQGKRGNPAATRQGAGRLPQPGGPVGKKFLMGCSRAIG
jgi:hypothetical protein